MFRVSRWGISLRHEIENSRILEFDYLKNKKGFWGEIILDLKSEDRKYVSKITFKEIESLKLLHESSLDHLCTICLC